MIVDSMRKYKQTAFEEGKVEGILEGKAEGILEGKLEGRLEGELEEKLKVARLMLHDQMDISLITKFTGLSESEILKLKNTSSH